jgi:hypothetical protein
LTNFFNLQMFTRRILQITINKKWKSKRTSRIHILHAKHIMLHVKSWRKQNNMIPR